MFTFSGNYWTSDLIVSADIELTKDFKSKVESILTSIKNKYSKFKDSDEVHEIPITNESMLVRYSIDYDYTCTLKGLAIDNIRKILDDLNSNSYIISFGGDIFGKSAPNTIIPIEGTDFQVLIDGCFSVFTSGNTSKRGDHIIGCKTGYMNTVVYGWNNSNLDYRINTVMDALATKSAANEDTRLLIELYEYRDQGLIDYNYTLKFQDGNFIGKTYCASPFFNDEQIEIRDKMVSKFTNVFRPDLQDNAIEYNDDQCDKAKLALAVVNDNIHGIFDSEFLVFPNDTDDLGTLFEVGVQLGRSRGKIIKYNRFTDKYTVMDIYSNPNDANEFLIDCSDKYGAILLGLHSFGENDNRFYELKGMRDNIMLSIKFTHVEYDPSNDRFDIYKPKIVEAADNSTEIIDHVSGLEKYRVTKDSIIEYLNKIYDTDIDVTDNIITSVS